MSLYNGINYVWNRILVVHCFRNRIIKIKKYYNRSQKICFSSQCTFQFSIRITQKSLFRFYNRRMTHYTEMLLLKNRNKSIDYNVLSEFYHINFRYVAKNNSSINCIIYDLCTISE